MVDVGEVDDDFDIFVCDCGLVNDVLCRFKDWIFFVCC